MSTLPCPDRNAKKTRTPVVGLARLAILASSAMGSLNGATDAAATESFEEAGQCRAGKSTLVRSLDRVYPHHEFRIFYTTQGKHALASVEDRNRNGVPDKVEDVATQLVAARQVYSDIIGLRHPLQAPRYGRVEAIDVFLFDTGQINGRAFDEVINNQLTIDGSQGRCTLRIDLRNNLANQNVTPAHELFHLYQYGYSMFKARWFLEGTARWAERAFRSGTSLHYSLPDSGDAIQNQIFSRTYASAGMWQRLAEATDSSRQIALSHDLAETSYIDGGRVLRGDHFQGAGFMKAVFEGMEALSANVAASRGWARYNWDENNQVRPVFDNAMLQAAIRIFLEYKADGVEHASDLEGFLRTVADLPASNRLPVIKE